MLALSLVFAACVGTPADPTPINEIPGDAPLICAVGAGGTVPDKLSATGIFSDLATLTPINGLHEYEVIAALWSDHSHKHRWMFLPKNTQIVFSPDGLWQFPSGTCLVKQFDLDLSPSATQKNTVHVETRVLLKGGSSWYGYTYQWNDDQSDAVLVPADGGTKTLTVNDPAAPGGTRQQTWSYPKRSDCLTCHNDSTAGPIGVRTEELNRDHAYAEGTENQLTHWNEQGLFTVDIGDPSKYAALTDPADATKPAAARARSYLAVNCAHCHEPGGTSGAQGMDFRYATALNDMGLIGRSPSRGNLGVDGALLVTPGVKEMSLVWLRMMATDSNHMPALGSALADPVGTGVVGDWIDGLGTAP